MSKCRFWFACWCLVWAVTVPGRVYAADTVALISDVNGKVAITVNSISSPAQLLGKIPLGAKIDLPASARLSMIYVATGEEFNLSGPGNYQADATMPQAVSGAAPTKLASIGGALNGKRIRPENVSQANLTLRGGSRKSQISLEPLSPSGSITLADPLQLHWQKPAEGLSYQVQLIDSQNKVLVSKEVSSNSFTLPQDITLAGGGYYLWNITTALPDGVLVNSSAQFKVVSNEVREQSNKLKPGKNGTISERVAYGLWLESENLANEAAQVWQELAQAYPDEPNIRERITGKSR